MVRILAAALVLLISSAAAVAQPQPQPQPQPADEVVLRELLHQFLVGAGRNDAAVHERFWAEDLIYTGSAGRRIGKAELMRGVRSAPAPKPGDAVTVYTAEDVRVQLYGDTAIVAFRLVGTTTRAAGTEVSEFLNSGTFFKRDGKWQAVNWQATKLPRAEEAVKKEVAAAEAAFHQAFLAGDATRLESLLDETFVRTFRDGSRQTRAEALDEVRSARLKFSRLETSDVTVNVYGDAAVARGKSLRQRTAIPGATADPAPFELFYTMTLVHKGGTWKIVALHASH